MTDGFGSPLTSKFPAKEFVKLVQAAQDDATGNLRAFSPDGTELLLETFASPRPHVCLHRIRRDNLPSEETGGRVQDLSIPDTNGLAEGTHIFFYPRNVVLVLYNHDGPRIGRLAHWFRARLGIDVAFEPVHRTDVGSIIAEMVRFNGVEIALSADQAAALLQDDTFDDDDVSEALIAASRLTGMGHVRIGLSVGPGMPSPQKQGAFKALVERLLGRDDLPLFRAARVTGVLPGGGTTVVDLIEDRLVAQQEVEAELSRYRRVSAASAAAAAEGTFELFKEQLSAKVPPLADANLDLPEGLLPAETPGDVGD